MVYLGTQVIFKLAQESTYGTYMASPGSTNITDVPGSTHDGEYINTPLLQTVDFSDENNAGRIYKLAGNRQYAVAYLGKYLGKGSFNFKVQDGHILYGLFGDYEADGSAGWLTEGDTLPSYQIEIVVKDSTGTKIVYNGVRFDTLSLSSTVDQPLTATVNWTGGKSRKVDGDYSSETENTWSSTSDVLMFYEGEILYDASFTPNGSPPTASGGTAIATITDFQLNMRNTLTPVWVHNNTTRGPSYLIPKQREYDISFTAIFNDTTMRSKFYDGATGTEPGRSYTPFVMALKFVDVKTGNLFEIWINDVTLNDIGLTANPMELLEEKLSGIAKNVNIKYTKIES